MKHAEITGLRIREPEKAFEDMMVAIGDSLSDLASSENGEDGEDEHDEETQQGKLSEDDEPGWVMGTITKTVQQLIERFRQKQMKLDQLTQPGWVNAAAYFRETDEKFGTCELRVPAVVQPQTDDVAAAPAQISFGELVESLEIAPGILHVPHWTSRLASHHIGLGYVKPQSNMSISGLEPTAERDMSHLLKAKHVELARFYPCI